jgi:hypothetical protein
VHIEPQLRERLSEIDGGELTSLSRGCAYSVVFPSAPADTFVYTTKTHAAIHLLLLPDNELPIGLVGRYGLPRDEDIARLADIVRGSAVCFLGDCDPFDLLVFASLQSHLPIRFLGTSDAVVSALGVDVNERITIPLSLEERYALPILNEVWPEYKEAVGANCSKLLDADRKLELEALVSYQTRPAIGLLDLLQEPA